MCEGLKYYAAPWCWRKVPKGDKGRGGKSWNALNEWDLLPFHPPFAVSAISRRVESYWSSSYKKIMTFTCEFSTKASERCHFASTNPLPKEFQSFFALRTPKGMENIEARKHEMGSWHVNFLDELQNCLRYPSDIIFDAFSTVTCRDLTDN